MPIVIGPTTTFHKLSAIAIDYTPAYEQGAGIGRYVRELVSALSQVDSQTPYSLFVAGSGAKPFPQRPGDNFIWKHTRITPSWLARLWHRVRLPIPIELFTGCIDLYHATDFVLPPHYPGTKTILTVHDLSFVRVPEAAPPSLRTYLNHVVPQSVHRADYVLADSIATKHDLIEVYGASSDKIEVLYGGVDGYFARVVEPELIMTTRSKYGLNSRPYILAIGTVQPRKNYGRLIQALAILRARGYDLSLVIAGGKGWLDDPIYEMIHTTRMDEFVHMIGFADEADLPALYSGAFALAYPSLYEGFGFPILEAMACGTPVVTSNVSSMPEAAGEAALLVNPYDLEELTHAFQRLVDDSQLRDKLVNAGYQQITKFTWKASAKQLTQVYQRVLTVK